MMASLLVCLGMLASASWPAAADPLYAEDLGALVPVPPGVTASFAVYDRQQHQFTAVRNLHARFVLPRWSNCSSRWITFSGTTQYWTSNKPAPISSA